MEQHCKAPHLFWRTAQVCAFVTGAAGFIAGLAWHFGHRFPMATGVDPLPMSGVLFGLMAIAGAGAMAFALWPVKAGRERDALSQRWAHLMDSLEDVVMLSDQQRRIVDMNRRAETLYGYTRAELVGMKLADLRAPDARGDFEQTRLDYETREKVVFQTVHRGKDGATFPVEISSRWVDVGTERLSLGIIRDITQRQQAEAALRSSEERSRLALEGATDGLWDCHLITGALHLSPRCAEMLGKRVDELPTERSQWEALLHPDDLPRFQAAWVDCLEGRRPGFQCESRLKMGNGDWLWLLARGKIVERNPDGAPVRVVGTLSDVTQRRRAEAALVNSERSYREIFNATTEAIFVHDAQSGALRDVNASMLRMYGYATKAEALRAHPADFSANEPPYTEAEFRRRMEQARREGPQVFEWHSRRQNGELFWVEVSLRDTHIGGEDRVLAVLRDITERKRAQQDLLESERRFRSVVENMNDALYVADFEGRILDINDQVSQMLGYSRAELVGASLERLDSEEQGRHLKERMRHLIQAGRVIFDGEHRRKDGSLVPVSISASVVSREGRGVIHGIVRDMTASKLTEAERERLIGILERTPDVVGISDLQGRSVYLNATGRRLMGEPVTASGQPRGARDFHPAWAADRVINEALPAARESGFWLGESALLTATGAELPVSQVILAHKNERGETTHYSTIMRDLSERKRFEHALRQNEERLRTIIEHSNQLHYSHTPEHVLTYVSPQSRQFFDCEPEEALVRWTEFITDHPVNSEGFKHTEAAIRTGQRQPLYELEVVTREGRKLWVEVDESPVVLRGKTVAVVGALTDITARKRSEAIVQRLARLGRELGAISEMSQVGEALTRAAQELLGWDACFLKVRTADLLHAHYLFAMDTINGQRVQVPPDARDEISPIERRIIESGAQLILREPNSGEMFIPFGDSSRPSLSLLYVPLRHQGQHLGMFSIQSYAPHAYDRAALELLQTLADHTAGTLERLRAEQALRASEAAYRRLHETMRDAYAQVDLQGRIQDCNRTFQEMLGYTLEELRQKTYEEITPARWQQYERRVVAEQVLIYGYSQVYEKEYLRKDGTVFPAELHTFLLRDDAGEPQGMWAIVRDITERKRSERSLAEREKRYRTLFDLSPVGILLEDAAGTILEANAATARVFGYSREELCGSNVRRLVPPERLSAVDLHAAAILAGQTLAHETVNLAKDGTLRHVELRETAIPLPDGSKGILVLVQDITERRRAEQALARSEESLRLALDGADLGSWDWDLRAGKITWGGHHDRLFGLASGQFDGTPKTFYRLLHPDDRKPSLAALRQAMRERRPYRHQYRVIWPDGSVRWIASHGRFHFDTTGHAVRMNGIVMDITTRRLSEEALRDSQRFLAKAQEVTRLGCYDLQIARGEWSSTPMLDEVFGLTPGYPKTVDGWLQLIHSEDREMMRQHLMEHVLHSGQRFEKEYRIIRPSDGQVRWLSGMGELVYDAAHHPVRMIGTIQDITDRKLAEATLRETEQRLARTIANLPAGFAYRCRNDRDWTMESITAGVAALTGCSPEEFTSGRKIWNDLIHPADRTRVWSEVQAALEERTSFQLEYRLKLPGGKESWLWEQGSGVFSSAGVLEGLEGLVVDITARKQAEAAARELTGRLLAAQDEERRRLARELHDTTAQTIAALCMNLTMLGARLPSTDSAATQLLAEAAELGEHAGQEIRTVAYLLHPPILEHVGLAGALREFAVGFSRRSGIAVTVEIGPNVVRYSPDIELALLRIVQESLGNVHRHSGSPTAIIRLRQAETEIVMDVADVGRGFRIPKATERQGGGAGVGVAGMRERLRHLGGRLELTSGPGGTIVRAILPLPKPARPGEN